MQEWAARNSVVWSSVVKKLKELILSAGSPALAQSAPRPRLA
jgi:hypothetical protein